MAEEDLAYIEAGINHLEQALPQIISMKTHKDGVAHVLEAATSIKEISLDPNFKTLGTSLKILSSGGSSALRTTIYQFFLTDLLEMLVELKTQINSAGIPSETRVEELKLACEYLIKYATRVTNRFKINVTFSPDYEAKAIRAFMVVKELSEVCRFLNMSPDLTMNATPNLDSGFEIDLMSQENAEELHRRVGSVLEVNSVTVFTETMNQQVMMLDPPQIPESFDNKVEEFLTG